jgi:hypothetical protein
MQIVSDNRITLAATAWLAMQTLTFAADLPGARTNLQADKPVLTNLAVASITGSNKISARQEEFSEVSRRAWQRLSPATFHMPEALRAEYVQVLNSALTLVNFDTNLVTKLAASTNTVYVVPVPELKDGAAFLRRIDKAVMATAFEKELSAPIPCDSLTIMGFNKDMSPAYHFMFIAGAVWQDLSKLATVVAHESFHIVGDNLLAKGSFVRHTNEWNAFRGSAGTAAIISDTLTASKSPELTKLAQRFKTRRLEEIAAGKSWEDQIKH